MKSHCRVVYADGLPGVMCNLHGASSMSSNVYLGFIWPCGLTFGFIFRRILFVLDGGHMPTAILSVRLLIFPLAIVLLIVVDVVVPIVHSSFFPAETLIACFRLRSPW